MILLTGANGQLGQDFQKLFTSLGANFIATDYLELDITNIDAVRELKVRTLNILLTVRHITM